MISEEYCDTKDWSNDAENWNHIERLTNICKYLFSGFITTFCAFVKSI